MDEHKTMMETCCNFIRLIRVMPDPVSAIIQERSELNLDFIGIYADVLFRLSEYACPFPDSTKEGVPKLVEI